MPIQTDGFTKDPGGSGGGSSDFGDITGWPGASTDFVRGDGTDSPLSAAEIDAAGGVVKSTIDAKGDLLVGTANDTIARQAVGSNDQVLTADSAQANGIKWAAVPAPTVLYMAASKSASQTVNNGNIDALLYGTPSVNTIGLTYSAGTWTATVAGWYDIEFQVTGSSASGQVMLYKNGSAYDEASGTGFAFGMRLRSTIYLGVGDTFSARAYPQGANTTLSTGSGSVGQIRAIYLGK